MGEDTRRVLVVGDGPVAEALGPMVTSVGWTPTVATSLPEVEQALPDSEVVVVLSHHDDVDGPAIRAALRHGPAYLGAMGSRRTQQRRRDWLLGHGVTEEEMDAVHGPAGLDIGADTPGEIALSILAEAVAVLRGRDDAGLGSLRGRSGPIHPELPPGTAECPSG